MDPDPLSLLHVKLQVFTPAATDYLLAALLLLLIIINAIVSGSEVAFFSLKENNSIDKDSLRQSVYLRINKLLQMPEKLFSSIILTNNLLNVTITVLSIHLLNKFAYFAIDEGYKLIFEVVIIICLILLFIDILPKLYASQKPERFAIRYAPLIMLINNLMAPFSTLLSKKTILNNRSIVQFKHDISMDDLSKALEITSDEMSGNQEIEMLEGIIRFRDKVVDDIKISRSDMIAIDIKTAFVDVIDFIVKAGFSRIPVYENNPDNIKGILYVKDLLPHLEKPQSFKWQTLIRSAYFVPGSKRIDDLLEEFRTNKIHMAIVVDEYGGTSGLVTMEDILEEIVGDISDEYDEELPFYTMVADGSYIFEGKTPLEEFIKITNVPEKDFEAMSEEVDTLAGLLLELKGDFPKRKEIFTYKKYTFQAEEMSKKRVIKVRYIPPKVQSRELN